MKQFYFLIFLKYLKCTPQQIHISSGGLFKLTCQSKFSRHAKLKAEVHKPLKVGFHNYILYEHYKRALEILILGKLHEGLFQAGCISIMWEESRYSHVFEHNQLLPTTHLLRPDLGCLVGIAMASSRHHQSYAEGVWKSPMPPDD